MKKLLLIFISIFALNMGFGQLASWELDTDSSPNGVNANISAGNFTGGSGIGTIHYISKGAYANNWFTSNSGPGTNYYFQVTLTPNSGYNINITDINFGERRTSEGIRHYKVEYSLNSDFSGHTTIATVNVPDNTDERTGNISGLNIDVPDGATIYIRWFGYGAETTNGAWRINDGTLNINGTVIDNTSEIYNNTQPDAASISSLVDTSNEAVEVFAFQLYDPGTTDGLDTKVTNIRIKPNSTNTADWTDNIQGAFFYDDDLNEYDPSTTNITDDYIDLTFPVSGANSITISDGGTITLTMYLYLETSNIEDGKVLSFIIDADDHGFTTDNSGSSFKDTVNSGTDITSKDFTIDVLGTESRFVQQPSNVSGNTAMVPAVTVEVTDENGNREMDLGTANIGLTTTGGFDSAATTSAQIDVSGIATFDNLVFNIAGTGLTLTANDTDEYGFTSVTSTTFDVTGAPEIDIQGNSTSITSGDSTPDTADDTDFGDVNYQDGSSVTHTFTIYNTGNVNLDLTDVSPYVTITGDTGDFTLDTNPSTPIAANGTTTFDIKFDPTTYGDRTATISIGNNDSDENPYTFDVKGNGISTDTVDWAQLNQENGNISSGDSFDVYTEIYEPSVTGDGNNNGTGFKVWIGYSTTDASVITDFESGWTWVEAAYNYDNGNNDGYMAEIGSSLAEGTYYFVSRIQLNGGPYKYGGYKSGGGGFWDGNDYVSGVLTVEAALVDWGNLQSPESGSQVIGLDVFNVYARVYEPSRTEDDDNTNDNIHVWIGWSAADNNPSDSANDADWHWIPAVKEPDANNGDIGDNDSYYADLLDATNGITTAGVYYYASRFQLNSGDYSYGGYKDGFWNSTYANGGTSKSGKFTAKDKQEISVKGNGVEIADGKTTFSADDYTDFGNVNVDGVSISRTYKIYNTGDVDLHLDGSPIVAISGTNVGDFTVSINPTSPVAADGGTTFTISFDPSDYGVRTATVSIDNDDDNEDPYNFDIKGTGATFTDCPTKRYYQDFESPNPEPEMEIVTQTPHLENSSTLSANSLYPHGHDYYANGSNALFIHGNYGSTLEFASVDTRTSNATFSIRLAAFSSTSGNGMEADDYVLVKVSADDGANYSEEIKITGNSNARWPFDTGTGTAKVAYDGNNSAEDFHPAAGGDRTTDGYSTVMITNLPKVEKMRIKIWTSEDKDAEYWMLDDAKIILTKSTKWDGTNWSDSAPSISTKAVFDGDYNTTSGNIHTCGCQVNSGKTLTVGDNTSVLVESDIVNNGTIIVANQGALVQHNDAASLTGDGTFQVNKTSQNLDHYYDYVYWSSPINSSYTLGDLEPNAWRYFKYDPNVSTGLYPYWVQLQATDGMQKGIGYAVSAPTGTSSATQVTANFVKDHDPFNNGVITVPILKKGGTNDNGDYNLVGNPYPSAIDFNALVADADNDANVEHAYSLWTNCAGLSGGHHQDSGYTTYSVSGANTAACSGSGSTAGQYIASGQGFMIKGADDDKRLTFKNAFRVTTNNDGFLNRSVTQRNIAWLDLTDDNSGFSQIAVGFYPHASNQYDLDYDAHSMNTGSGFALYSLLGSDKMAIQGLADLDNTERTVPIGVESDVARNINIHLNRTEGLENEYIYLHDLYLNIWHDIKATDYLTTVNGTEDDRFELVFTRTAMDVNENILDPNLVSLVQNDGLFSLRAHNDKNMTAVYVYDLAGRLLFKQNDINSQSLEMNLKHVATGNMLLFRIQMQNHSFVVKKAIRQ